MLNKIKLYLSKKTNKKNNLIGKKIEIKFIAPDTNDNKINKILVLFTNSNNKYRSYYNIPSLIFLEIDYWDIENKSSILIYSEFPDLINVKIFINDIESTPENLNIDILSINIELIREHFISNKIE